MQLLQIITVQFLMFEPMLANIRMMLSLFHPATWTDIKRPGTSAEAEGDHFIVRSMSRAVFVGFIALCSCAFKLIIQYQVSILSISIVLECNSCKEAIFNSLVISFVADLGQPMWTV